MPRPPEPLRVSEDELSLEDDRTVKGGATLEWQPVLGASGS